ncbi:MAG TPA: Eco57I restriction-modification methylase domain-containing protein, partial [Candidatus Hodarchaeales archaeon]|nr:Eco57I restriction-modification methylase domain-containing protein [Candidatus Hodarchaeales archaeon]
MLTEVEQTRLEVSKRTEAKKKSQLGQFLTPAKTAQFMAGLFSPTTDEVCRLVDPGAGIGSLSAAFLERIRSGELCFESVGLSAFEIDNALSKELQKTLSSYAKNIPLSFEIQDGDFIENGLNTLQFSLEDRFTHAILNPPYKKIGSNSRHRALLRQAGIETVNLYTGFVALTLALMKPGGEVVAIIPRSFCNGPYYRAFRQFVLERAAIKHIHLFDSRERAFKDDGVLQENVIIKLESGGEQENVTVSTSADDSFADLKVHSYPFDRIIFPDDQESFIHIPTYPGEMLLDASREAKYSLEQLGVSVSTGPVVDFRMKEHLR